MPCPDTGASRFRARCERRRHVAVGRANQPHGDNVPNIRRITVHGSTPPLERLSLTIDPEANAANGADAFGPSSCKRIKP